MNWKQIEAEWDKDPEFRKSFEEDYPYESVGRAIARLRAEHDLTQEELARRIGTSQPVIARAEGGRHGVNTNLLNRIAKAVGTTWGPVFASANLESRPVAEQVSVAYSDFEWVFDRDFVSTHTVDQIIQPPLVQPANAWFTHGKVTTLVRIERTETSDHDEPTVAAGNRQSTLALAG